ncbi:hypothetical protein IE81DRAFT_350049 [Ceraceosorus guamensis]|uniref:C2H2-type domain-containing protein n=1 Tax=Ceraceosorus guamensis TaxID=1522189 RepID=A0A316VPL7_9BASI|nr:hypothetical protein IE81DRAFT_350049 [Ceraceosorus guamensis]PWN39589.1 hypothetical protein IE81DRAFT_350049 [Ceraceosorus guamensis]
MPYARKRSHHGRRDIQRAMRTRARKLDADQISDNLRSSEKTAALLNPSNLDVDKPGLGLFYCIQCDRHFPTDKDRESHLASKQHKRSAKRAAEEAHTVAATGLSVGVGVDNTQRSAPSVKASVQTDQMAA